MQVCILCNIRGASVHRVRKEATRMGCSEVPPFLIGIGRCQSGIMSSNMSKLD